MVTSSRVSRGGSTHCLHRAGTRGIQDFDAGSDWYDEDLASFVLDGVFRTEATQAVIDAWPASVWAIWPAGQPWRLDGGTSGMGRNPNDRFNPRKFSEFSHSGAVQRPHEDARIILNR